MILQTVQGGMFVVEIRDVKTVQCGKVSVRRDNFSLCKGEKDCSGET